MNGNLVRAHNPEVTLKQAFDRGNRLLSSQQTQGAQQHTLHYQYDEFGRRTRLALPDGKRLQYRYNQHSQLTAIELSEGDSSQTLAVFQYDKQNRLIQQTFGNHIALEQTFDVFHRLTQQNLTHPEQRLYDQCAYQYDGIDQLIGRQSQTQTSQQEEGGFAQAKQEAFEYNTLGQLIKESVAYTQGHQSHSSQRKHTEFEWDSVGNPIAQRTVIESDEAKSHSDEKEENKGELSAVESEENIVAFAENDPSIQAITEGDRLLKFADIDFDYDDCGNQISELGVGVKTQRSFNAFNQLTRFAKDGVLTQYDYDPLGRRIAKHTEQGKIDFIWDGNQLLGECLNGQYTWYINRPNEFHPVALIKQDEVYYYHLDQLNTPRFVTNKAAEVVWENTANAYGYEDNKQQAEREGQSKDFYQPIRFQGQYFDQESGFHYNRFRYYCPKQQRFIHQDPIGIVGGINHYQYAPNPVNWVDPMGLSCKEGAQRTVFAGHGSIDQSNSFVVPAGSTLTVYAWDGATITEDLGQLIESGNPISNNIYRKVYKAGDSIPGYVLWPNDQGDLVLSESSIQVSEPTHISTLLAENMGDCHWAACASIMGHENEFVIHHTEGIFREDGPERYSQYKEGKWEGLEAVEADGSKRNVGSSLTRAINPSDFKPKKKRKKSLRLKYLGRTPGKKSRTGREVIARMRKEGKIKEKFGKTIFKASDGVWYPIEQADMAHEPMDAVRYWNTVGKKYGAKSKKVREWMLDSNNYTLDHYCLNRSAGAKVMENYLPSI